MPALDRLMTHGFCSAEYSDPISVLEFELGLLSLTRHEQGLLKGVFDAAFFVVELLIACSSFFSMLAAHPVLASRLAAALVALLPYLLLQYLSIFEMCVGFPHLVAGLTTAAASPAVPLVSPLLDAHRGWRFPSQRQPSACMHQVLRREFADVRPRHSQEYS